MVAFTPAYSTARSPDKRSKLNARTETITVTSRPTPTLVEQEVAHEFSPPVCYEDPVLSRPGMAAPPIHI